MSDLAGEIEARIPSGRKVTVANPIYSQVPEARLYARLTPELIKLIYCDKPHNKKAWDYALKIERVVQDERPRPAPQFA